MIFTILWDEKLMIDISNGTMERLAIYVSGTPHCLEDKLIHIIAIPIGTGEIVTKKLIKELKDTVLDVKGYGAMVFDTTSSNNGVHKGATTRLENLLGIKLSWQHSKASKLKLILQAVWKHLFGRTISNQ